MICISSMGESAQSYVESKDERPDSFYKYEYHGSCDSYGK